MHGRYLGSFPTADEAALCYARHVGKVATEQLEERQQLLARPMTSSEALAEAEKEGLVLIVTNDRRNISGGYKGVRLDKVTGKFQVRHQHQNKRKHLGIFHTAEEAALCYARYMRDTGR